MQELTTQQEAALQAASQLLAVNPHHGVSTRDIADLLEIPIEAVKPILTALVGGGYVVISGAGIIQRLNSEEARKQALDATGRWSLSQMVAIEAGPRRYHPACARQIFGGTNTWCLYMLENAFKMHVAQLVETFGVQRVADYWPQHSSGAFLEVITQAQWEREVYAQQRYQEKFNNQCAHCQQELPFNPF